jgi:hypothetical protein
MFGEALFRMAGASPPSAGKQDGMIRHPNRSPAVSTLDCALADPIPREMQTLPLPSSGRRVIPVGSRFPEWPEYFARARPPEAKIAPSDDRDSDIGLCC